MGIVSENAEIVRFLLKSGADVSQRTCGNFFTCDDQKSSRTDSPDQEAVVLGRHTTYSGQAYLLHLIVMNIAIVTKIMLFGHQML